MVNAQLHRNRATPIVNGRKLCRGCLVVKLISGFPKCSKNTTGVYGHCKQCTNAQNKLSRERNRNSYSYANSWQKRNPEWRRRNLSERYRKLKKQILEAYGCKCALCGFSDQRALQIDHVNNDGAADRKSRTPLQRMKAIVALGFPSDYRILCANCNAIQAVEAGLLRYTPVEVNADG